MIRFEQVILIVFLFSFWCEMDQDLQKLEQYLPLLENLIFHVDLVCSNHHVVRWISELKIRWTSALGSSSFLNLRGTKLFQIDHLHY